MAIDLVMSAPVRLEDAVERVSGLDSLRGCAKLTSNVLWMVSSGAALASAPHRRAHPYRSAGRKPCAKPSWRSLGF